MITDKIYMLVKKVWHVTYIRARDFFKKWRYDRYWREHRIIGWGGVKYTDKTFYIIRRREVYTGLFSDFIIYVYKTKLALDAGCTPIIDMQTTENMYLRADQIGKVNAWEFYFKQPAGYSLSDIAKAKRVIVSSGYCDECFPYLNADYILNKDGDFDVYQSIVSKYFNINDEAQKAVDDFYKRELQNEKVLGVLCRGTDYTGNKPFGHPIQPSLESMFQKVDEVLEQYHCSKIFLGTEDIDIYAQFKEKYKNTVVTNRKHFVQYNGEGSIAKLIQNNVEDLKAEGMQYLVTIALLARCNCFVGGYTSGTVGVLLMNGQFEYKYIFNLGLYS